MRKVYLIASTLLLFFVAACNSDKQDKVETNTVTNTTSNTVFNQQLEHSFSDLTTKDKFEVTLTGNKPEDMLLSFSISNKEGKIYDVQIKGKDLLGSSDPNVDLRTEASQILFIQTIAKEFLNEDNFLNPAVMPDHKPDEYTPDKEFHNELKTSRLIGFTYTLGKENNIYIAWSAKDKKVKVYYNCC